MKILVNYQGRSNRKCRFCAVFSWFVTFLERLQRWKILCLVEGEQEEITKHIWWKHKWDFFKKLLAFCLREETRGAVKNGSAFLIVQIYRLPVEVFYLVR